MKTRLRHLGNPVLLILLVLLVAAIVTARGTIADHPGPPEAGLAALIEEARNHQPLAAENAGEGDRCQLPFLRAKDGEALPLRSNNATVEINGVVAHVTLSQEFANPTDAPLNAAYVFPMSTRAAVHGLTMKIGDREIEGVIQEKNKARKTFNAAKKKGKRATLLEQERPNIFQTEVANIPAEGSIVVTITYTESLIPVSGEYSFVLPTTVVERYGENPEGERPDWSLNPYIQCDQSEADGTTASSTFVWDVNATIKGGLPISKAHCPSHKVKTTFINKTEVAVALDPNEKNSADRDFILNYRLTGDAVQSGLLIHKDKELEENFFLLTIQPPKRVAPEHIPPREYVFLVDFSGSMSGFPIEVSKAAMGNLLGSLRPHDRFNIVLFAGSSARMSPTTLEATPGNMRKAERWLDGHHAGGGTKLLTGLNTAFDTFSHHDASKTMIVLTDGFVHFEKSAFTLIEQRLDEANVFALGIGKNVNRHCIEGMAAAGQGEPWIATNRSEALRVSSRLIQSIALPVLTDIEFDFDGMEAYDLEPPVQPDLFADRPLTITGKFRGDAARAVTMTGRCGEKEIETVMEFERKPEKNKGLPFLWARERLRRISDFQKISPREDFREEITNLGLTYQLVTKHTSFVAVEREIPDLDRLNKKLGKGTNPAPEPSTALFTLTSLGWLMLRRRRRQS